MTKEEFLEELERKGFPPPVEVRREANGSLNVHSHSFEVRALIIEGDITLVVEDVETTYRTGEVFHLKTEQPHAEWYGSQGVVYLASRK